MQINLDPGEDLTIVTLRGVVSVKWAYDSEDFVIFVGFDPEKSKAETFAQYGQKSAVNADLTIACQIHLSKIKDDRHA